MTLVSLVRLAQWERLEFLALKDQGVRLEKPDFLEYLERMELLVLLGKEVHLVNMAPQDQQASLE